MSHQNTPGRIKKQYYATKFFSEGGFFIPIWLLFLTRQCGLDEGSAFLVESSFCFAIMFSEMPSGAWADRFGRKRLLLIAAALRVVSLLIYCCCPGFYFLVIAAILQGVAASASSGTIEALTTDNLKSQGIDSKDVFENGHALFFLGRAFVMLTGGFLYTLEPVFPYLASVGFTALFALVVLRIEESPFERSQASNNLAHFKKTISLVRKDIILFRWLACVTLVFIFSNLSWFEYQSIFTFFGWTAESIGLLYCLNALFSCFGAWLAKKLFQFIDCKTILIVCTLLWGTGTLALTINSLPIIISGIFLYSLACGAIYPAYVRLANERVDAEQRATTISLITFVDGVTCGAGTAVAGYMNQSLGVINFMRLVGMVLLGLVVVPYYFIPKEKKVAAL